MTEGETAPIGIICAIPEEIAHFGGRFAEREVADVAGLPFRLGTLDGRAVVLAETGVGKVNAALVATLLCDRFACRALLFSGVAGGVDPALSVGDIVVADRVVQYDYGALIAGRLKPYQPGVLPLPGFEGPLGYAPDAALLERVHLLLQDMALPPVSGRTPTLAFGPILTGDAFVACADTRQRLAAEFGALAVEMEGGAMAQVAERFGRPWLVVRALSDLAGEESSVDFPTFLPQVAAGAALVVERLVRALDPPPG